MSCWAIHLLKNKIGITKKIHLSYRKKNCLFVLNLVQLTALSGHLKHLGRSCKGLLDAVSLSS